MAAFGEDTGSRRRIAARVGALLLLVLVSRAVFLASSPPAPRPVTAPASEFSAARAWEHLRFIGAAPHPVGSPRHAEVRDYLLARLEELGIEAHVQRESLFVPEQEPPWLAATVENVVGRVRGTGAGPAVLLMAHYDSVPTGPGASDNGAGVSALVEVARALRTGPAPERDVLLLFSDAEEQGLLGSRAFVASHPWAREVGVVLNVDARGNEGPVLMFETSRGSGGLIERLGWRPGIETHSLYVEVYRRMPNDTDFTPFREGGWQGLNFANLEGSVRYHTRLETVDAVDPGTLQHQGDTLLSLARRFSTGEPVPPAEAERVFFNVGPFLVHYPEAWVLPLMALTLGLLATVLVRGVRSGAVRPSRVARELAAQGLALAGAALAASLVWPALLTLRPDLRAFTEAETYDNPRFIAAVAMGTVALVLGVLAARRQSRPAELAAAGCLPWALGCVLTSVLVPGASGLFLWPLVPAIAALALLQRQPEGPGSAAAVLLCGLCAAPMLLLVLPVASNLFVALTLDQAGVPAALLAAGLLLCAPCWVAVLGPGLPRAAGATAALALALLGTGAVAHRFDSHHPRPSNLVYLLDADAGVARWLSSDAEASGWTREYLGAASADVRVEGLADWSEPLRAAPAPPVALPPPSVSIEEEPPREGRRYLSARLASPRAAAFVDVQVQPVESLRAVRLAGRRVEAAALRSTALERGLLLRYWAPPPEGFILELEVDAGAAPLVLRVSDHSYALPAAALAGGPARPADTMPVPSTEALDEGTRVMRTLVLGAEPTADGKRP